MRDISKIILKPEYNITCVAAHDNNLQCLSRDNTHYIVSITLRKTKYVNKRKAIFASEDKSFSVIRAYDNDDVYSEFWTKRKGYKTCFNKLYSFMLSLQINLKLVLVIAKTTLY